MQFIDVEENGTVRRNSVESSLAGITGFRSVPSPLSGLRQASWSRAVRFWLFKQDRWPIFSCGLSLDLPALFSVKQDASFLLVQPIVVILHTGLSQTQGPNLSLPTINPLSLVRNLRLKRLLLRRLDVSSDSDWMSPHKRPRRGPNPVHDRLLAGALEPLTLAVQRRGFEADFEMDESHLAKCVSYATWMDVGFVLIAQVKTEELEEVVMAQRELQSTDPSQLTTVVQEFLQDNVVLDEEAGVEEKHVACFAIYLSVHAKSRQARIALLELIAEMTKTTYFVYRGGETSCRLISTNSADGDNFLRDF
ncbi:hypothetical protein KC363_g200 [Hortaea werneckii]|nr:hypothetical protein KC363_g200 [Hortaea werneckii]